MYMYYFDFIHLNIIIILNSLGTNAAVIPQSLPLKCDFIKIFMENVWSFSLFESTLIWFFNDTATTEIYTIVGSVRCV